MELKLRNGRRTRIIDVPLCEKCNRIIQRESGEEERLHRMERVVVLVGSVLMALIVFLILGSLLPIVVRLLISATSGAVVGFILLTTFRRLRADAALPEKKAVLASAQMVEFSWRATTFAFENEEFFDKFRALNQEELMEV